TIHKPYYSRIARTILFHRHGKGVVPPGLRDQAWPAAPAGVDERCIGMRAATGRADRSGPTRGCPHPVIRLVAVVANDASVCRLGGVCGNRAYWRCAVCMRQTVQHPHLGATLLGEHGVRGLGGSGDMALPPRTENR